jgi:hypothetical protein
MKPLALVFVAAVLALTLSARADQSPIYKGKPSASEAKFVSAIQQDLNSRFAHANDAERAGYLRYTNVDDTGAISYANMQWQSADIRHPSQLWYDAGGNLLGADFSVLNANHTRPNLWGVNPGRWYQFDGHVHYVQKDPKTGKLLYDKYVMDNRFTAAGGDPEHPSAQTLVKMGKVRSAGEVVTIFHFPNVYDLIVWVKPNPNGAFAYKNPLVKK